MIKKYNLFLLFFLPVLMYGHPENFYIEIGKKGIEVGQYEGNNFKKKPLRKYAYHAENIAEIKQLLLADGEENVLYVIWFPLNLCLLKKLLD